MSLVKPTSESHFSVSVNGGTATVPLVNSCCDLRGLRWADADGVHPTDLQLNATFIETVVKTILSAGRHLRFEALGLSMRPLLASGSVIEIAPVVDDAVRAGALMMYGIKDHRLVIHRIIDVHDDGTISLRGDNASRVDRVTRSALLGVAVAVVSPDGKSSPISSLPWAPLGPALNVGNAGGRRLVRMLVVVPFVAIVRTLRTPLGACVGALSWLLHRMAVSATRLRLPLDRFRSLLLTTAKKNAIRQNLYADLSVQDFTALSENMAAGLTLLEEHQLRRDQRTKGTSLVVGCGPGREALELQSRGYTVTGIDSEQAMLARAEVESRKRSLHVTWQQGEATTFELPTQRFDTVVVWSGLLCMIYPSARRTALLQQCAKHLAPNGRVMVTFLCEYAPPGSAPHRPRVSGIAQRINPDHEPGDLWLHNEAVHVYPSVEHVLDEGQAAGLEPEVVFKDQRAYDRRQHVKGYVTFRVADG